MTAKGDVIASGTAVHLGEPRSEYPVTAIGAHPEAAGYWILNRHGRVFGYGASRVMGTPVGPGAAAIAGTRVFTWMTRNAKTYGLYNLPSEPWHWSTNGR
ncbi:MAG: hypothetical protein GEU74_08820 [Nitriliruptorales bacterium]|nr:hypothetical protein [Nitriliruptorales bacterium]